MITTHFETADQIKSYCDCLKSSMLEALADGVEVKIDAPDIDDIWNPPERVNKSKRLLSADKPILLSFFREFLKNEMAIAILCGAACSVLIMVLWWFWK